MLTLILTAQFNPVSKTLPDLHPILIKEDTDIQEEDWYLIWSNDIKE